MLCKIEQGEKSATSQKKIPAGQFINIVISVMADVSKSRINVNSVCAKDNFCDKINPNTESGVREFICYKCGWSLQAKIDNPRFPEK